MAVDPWFNLFPTVGALTFAALVVGLFRRRRTLGGMAADWMVAFLFGALAMLGALAAGVANLSDPADFVLAYAGAAAGVALVAAYSGLFQRYTRGRVGAPAFRWTLYAAALGLEGFGWGALAASPGAPGDGVVATWAVVPVALAAAALVPIALLAARHTLSRAGAVNAGQLFVGNALLAASFVTLALGDPLTGSAVGMAGAGFLYSGASAAVGLAPAASAPAVRPKVEAGDAERGGAGGVKVRVPKGAAQRVTAFRDDDMPPENYD